MGVGCYRVIMDNRLVADFWVLWGYGQDTDIHPYHVINGNIDDGRVCVHFFYTVSGLETSGNEEGF